MTAFFKIKPFSVHNFQQLLGKSRAKKYLSQMEIEQIRVALEQKNRDLLKKLYVILQQEQMNDEEIVRNFVMTKNQMLSDLEGTAKGITKKYFNKMKFKKIASAEKIDQAEASKILKTI